MKKLLVVASMGGHWIQLLRIAEPLSNDFEIVYVSTHEKCSGMVSGKFYRVPDFNRQNVWRVIPAFFKSLRIMLKERPKVIVSTGAAPGLMLIIVARLFFRKTIWIDSVANVQRLSSCGKMACFFAHKVYSQWPNLANEKVHYAGNIFGD